MNCILVPTLAQDISLLERLAKSIDYNVEDKVVVNNGKEGALDEWQSRHPDWEVLHYGKNLGVGGSWNLALEIFPDQEAYLMVNDDFVFQPNQLQKICLASNDKHKLHPTIHFTETEGYNCFVWTKKAIDEIGLFDENFYPAYYEDYDYRVRMRLAGLKPYIIGLKDSDITHGKPYSGGKRYRNFLDELDVYHRAYYGRKWGKVTDNHYETFRTPFNNPGNKVDFWELEIERQSSIMNIWNEFMCAENPLICE